MLTPDPTPSDDSTPPNITSPRKTSAGKKTPNGSPKNAPGARQRSGSKKAGEPPTLLADFLMGRPSPARVAAERQRRKDLDLVKADIKQEMKQTAVRRVQPPGGVKDRVKAWQKANAAVVANPTPDDAVTEPPEAAFEGEEVESVTEEDRVRIKMRQRRRPASKSKPPIVKISPELDAADGDSAASPPKKRVVSDEHWMKSRVKKSPPRKVSPRAKKSASPSPTPATLPKNFVARSGPNPSASSKIKSWAQQVEIPDTPPPRSYRSSASQDRKADQDSSSSKGGDGDSQATARLSRRSQASRDDGIRVTPMKAKRLDDDGIRVTPGKPLRETGQDQDRGRSTSNGRRRPNESPLPRESTKPRPRPRSTVSQRIEVIEGSEISKSQRSEGKDSNEQEEPGVIPDTPTKCPGSRNRPNPRTRPKTYHADSGKALNDETWVSDDETESALRPGSDLTSSLAAKSVADIPGDIPFGHSAFSELDLPLRGTMRSRPKRTKVERSSSLQKVPNVFKKVVEESKKIIQDMNEPPKQPAANKPPSIEKWLNGTVDPFVESSNAGTATPSKPKTVEKEWAEETKARRKVSEETKPSELASTRESAQDEGTVESQTEVTASSKTETEAHQPEESEKTPTSAGLRRSRATRSSSSPWKVKGKQPFLNMLKEAFQGESSAPSHPLNNYQSHEQRRSDNEYNYIDRSAASESRNSPPRAESTQSEGKDNAKTATVAAVGALPSMSGPRFRPPTKGHHELSTIMSEEDSSAVDSDMTSDLTASTQTQSTSLTKDSDLSRSPKQEPGLKRRLTKHSDLVSVLSLPDDGKAPQAVLNNRSRPSLRSNRSASGPASPEELLKEFVEDENLYLRELKTLVDGVVPVLLSQVVGGGHSPDFFGSGSAGDKASSLSKSVVGMGVSLEKLHNAHRRAPANDLRKLGHWAHGVVPTYNSYINAWRLGFQDLIVNLAPATSTLGDEDSLLNALPRNDNGDVLDVDGGRVDVGHLLKRPLVRVKQMTKLIKCMDTLVPSPDTNVLLRDFENLQDKARRRHREETARMTDEDAINTDTTRARDLLTLEALDLVTIDRNRQVSAKDVFSLELAHSNGQRLECQVELVHRDTQLLPDDEGDLLIREVGDGRKNFLLFPPLSMSLVSARTGEGNFDMVIMCRGPDNARPWYELLTLTADNEDQILDWLDIFPVTPVPPRMPEPSVLGDLDSLPSQKRRSDVPVGARSTIGATPNVEVLSPEDPVVPSTPTRRPFPQPYERRDGAQASPRQPASPRDSPDSMSSQRTPTQAGYESVRPRDTERSRTLSESMRPEPLVLKSKGLRSPPESAPLREDGAPPPPVHRTLSPKPARQQSHGGQPSPVQPPPDLKAGEGVRRRGSSPLKHEYFPSNRPAEAAPPPVEELDDSSDDEIDGDDVPETELGFSIEKGVPRITESQLSASDCSLTPSNSASQAGLHGPKIAPEENAARYMASISRWSEKGTWKDVSNPPCTIIVKDGLIEAYLMTAPKANSQNDKPLLALDLTPLVLIRQSTALDLEIRSSVQSHCQLSKHYPGGNFRFRCFNGPECFNLYMAVHHARLNNQKFIQLENEARFNSFGERSAPAQDDGDSSSRRRSWFGRKNSYRGSVRAPPQSFDGASTTPSTNVSASSFLKRLTGGGNLPFNIARSSIDRRSVPGSGGNSLYTSGSSSAGGTPRSPSISVGNSGRSPTTMNPDNIRIRLHLLVTAAKWEDFGNCILQIRRPPPGWHQALRADHGLEKRITVTTLPRKDSEKPRIVLDAVLGSGCFSPMGNRGIVCGIWEEAKAVGGVEGAAPATGPTGGNIKKWCFQFAAAPEASWALRTVHQEVQGLMV